MEENTASGQTDEELLHAAAAGINSGLEGLYNRYSSRVFNLALRLLSDYEQAEDITQDVFVKIYRSANRFRYKSLVSTWIYRITVNRCLNILRKKRFFINRLDEFLENSPGSSFEIAIGPPDRSKTKVETQELEHALFKALQSLPPRQRTVFVLSRNEHLSNREIALILNTSVSAVEARLHRARKKLQKILISYK